MILGVALPLSLKKILTSIVLISFPCKGVAQLVLTAGPEVYYFERNKEGGTQQKGRMDGVRVTLERIAPCAFYLGVDAFYAEGTMKGHSSSGRRLVSEFTDLIYEGRLGYNLTRTDGSSFIIPYGGYGRFFEKNAFRKPSPLPLTFKDSFNYIAAGFLSGLKLTPLISMGVNFEAKFMSNGKSEVTNDPMFDDVTLIMNNELQARIEIPIVWQSCDNLDFQIVPFYEFRHFGGREDFPFDFIDTKFHLVGLRLALGYCF